MQCAALCVTVMNHLRVICNGILGPKEYPLGFFRPKSFFLEPYESPNAAAIIPLRGGSKAIGNTRSFITAFFKKAQNSSVTLPTSHLWLGHGATLFSRTRVLITVQYGFPVPEGGANLAFRTSWCSGGLREPSLSLSLCPQNCSWLLRYPMADREKAPNSIGLLGILVGQTLKPNIGHCFFSLVLRASLGEVADSLSSIQICL